MRTWLVVLAVLAGCGSKKDKPAESVKELCTKSCAKMMSCLGVDEDSEEADCVERCEQGARPDDARMRKIIDGTCEDVLAEVHRTGAASDVEAPIQAPGGCSADCRGCAGDSTSCYMAAGGANGIPCDSCCCASGGPAPTTPE